jgi:hypothetical protein
MTNEEKAAEKKMWVLRWAPTMEVIAVVEAEDASTARRRAPQPYRKFLGEIDAEMRDSAFTRLLAESK